MNERELRAEVAKRRERIRGSKEDDVDEKYWQYLNEMGFVQEALEMQDKPAVDYLVKQIDRMVDAVPKSAKQGGFLPTGRNWGKVFTPQLSLLEQERARLFEDYLAVLAANDFNVQAFRDRVLGGKKLGEEEAYTFLDSPARQFFGRSFFEAQDIPLLEHTATVQECKLEFKVGVRPLGFSVHIEPPDITKTAYLKRNAKGHLPKLAFPGRADPDGRRRAESISVNIGSVLDDLRKLSENLAKRYPWQPADATWFVLTHKVPAVPPARGQYKVKRGGRYAYGEITLTVMPWVSTETVGDLHRKLQQQALGADDRPLKKKPLNQPLKEKALKLMRFVMERVYPLGLSPKERENLGWLVDEWNQTDWVREQPKEAKRKRAYYGQDKTRKFWRDFSRALRAVAYQPLSRQQNGSSSGSNRGGKLR